MGTDRKEINKIYKFLKKYELLDLGQDKLIKILKKSWTLRKEFISYFVFLENRISKYTYENKIKIIKNLYKNKLKTFNDVRCFINNNILDRDNEVSVCGLKFYVKIFPELGERIMYFTKNYPSAVTITHRCEFIRKNIVEFPKCIECNNCVSWAGRRLLNHCSVECVHNSSARLEKIRNTKFKKYGNSTYTNPEKMKATNLIVYGFENPSQSLEVQEKRKQTCIETFGFDNPFSSPVVTQKRKDTMMEKYGVEYSSQSPEIQSKILESSYKVCSYKESSLTYQGSYELFFLELMENRGLLNEISVPEPVNYTFDNKPCVYYPDYEFRGQVIEIKSSWTYNKNGADKNLEEKNNTKWDTVKSSGSDFIALIDKDSIKDFVNGL